MNRAFLPLFGFLLLTGLFLFVLLKMNSGEYDPRDIPTEFIGAKAPPFAAPDLFDPAKAVTSEQMAGHTWLFNFWGTWCPECWREHEYLVTLARRDGIPIVGVNWRDDPAEAKKMLGKLGNPFLAIASDPKSAIAIDWGVYGAPETFLIDADGIIREKHKGPLNEQVWREKFAKYFQQRGAQ